MLTGFRYRLAPTGEQAGLCQVYGDICRAVWNTGLHQRREAVRRWQRGQDLPFCGYHLQARQLAEAKTEEEWLKAAPSHILQQTLRDLDRACRDHGTFNVRWRAKGRWKPSFRFPAGARVIVQRLGRKWGRLKLPKLGWVRPLVARTEGHRPLGHRLPRRRLLVRVDPVRGRPDHPPGA
ncbi:MULTISPECIES: helix-turn-helix domain-containing protein [Nocardiopsis]|uniref:helix-turn-helix domain-containing protein n=1 Tax=Nocardiopsis TaxID=2013 RepID=UPI001F47234E|nr:MULTISPECIES: helix-turn-helix domain-containing protein [Nocardiopsis]